MIVPGKPPENCRLNVVAERVVAETALPRDQPLIGPQGDIVHVIPVVVGRDLDVVAVINMQ